MKGLVMVCIAACFLILAGALSQLGDHLGYALLATVPAGVLLGIVAHKADSGGF